jgi:hypothetical protein
MPSTFTDNTGIEKIGDGEQTGAWGQITNDNFDIIDRALNGSVSIALSGTTHTLTTSDGILSDGQYAVLVFAGSPSGTNTVTIAPNTAQKTYIVRNTTAQSVVLTQGSGGNVTVPAGLTKLVYADGGGVTAAVVDITSSLAINGGTINGTVIGGTTGVFSGNLTVDTNTLFVDAASNRVGVGTISPAEKLTVSDAICIVSSVGTAGFGAFYAKGSGTNPSYLFFGNGGGETGRITSDDNDNLVFSTTTGANERMRITSAGNVGIGTANPNTALQVAGIIRVEASSGEGGQIELLNTANTAVSAVVDVDPANNLRIFNISNTATLFLNNATEHMRINSAGNVGIGTSVPSTKLHVNGTITASAMTLGGVNVPKTYISTSAPTGGADGDLWFQYS